MTTNQSDWFSQMQALVESNARSIQALGDRIAEITHDIDSLLEAQRQASSEREELRKATIGIANLLSSLDEDRPTIFRKLNTIENKVDRLLEKSD